MVEWTELNILLLQVSLFSSVVTVKTDVCNISQNASTTVSSIQSVNCGIGSLYRKRKKVKLNSEISRLLWYSSVIKKALNAPHYNYSTGQQNELMELTKRNIAPKKRLIPGLQDKSRHKVPSGPTLSS